MLVTQPYQSKKNRLNVTPHDCEDCTAYRVLVTHNNIIFITPVLMTDQLLHQMTVKAVGKTRNISSPIDGSCPSVKR